MRYPAIALAILLGGCATDGNRILSDIASIFEPDRPETAALSSELPEVRQPATLSGLEVKSLVDGSTKRFDIAPFGTGYRVRQDNGCVWTRQAHWFSPSDSWTDCGDSQNWHTATARVRETDALYPLRVGSEGRFERHAISHTGRSYVRETVCRVTDAVDVVRPGFPDTSAWVVACDDGKRVRTTWYAPGEGPVAFTQLAADGELEESWIKIR